MKCNVCGFENQPGNAFCTSCGAALEVEPSLTNDIPESTPNPAALRLNSVISSSLFTAICILLSVSFGAGLLVGSFSIITLLAMIFCWLIFAASKKGAVDANQMRNLSGTIYAQYIINYIVSGLFVFCGVIMAAVFSTISPSDLLEEFDVLLNGSTANLDLISNLLFSLSGVFFLVLFVFIAAIFIVVNVLAIRKIHRFVKSAYTSVLSGAEIYEFVNGAKNWLLVLGILSAISTCFTLLSGEFLSAISTGASAAALIVGSRLIKNNFCE